MTIFNVSSRIISANHCWNVFPFMNILTTTQRNAQSHLREQFVIFFFSLWLCARALGKHSRLLTPPSTQRSQLTDPWSILKTKWHEDTMLQINSNVINSTDNHSCPFCLKRDENSYHWGFRCNKCKSQPYSPNGYRWKLSALVFIIKLRTVE